MQGSKGVVQSFGSLFCGFMGVFEEGVSLIREADV